VGVFGSSTGTQERKSNMLLKDTPPKVQEAVRWLTANGFAVVLFTEEELRGVDATKLEGVCISAGNNYISYHGDDVTDNIT
jgi:hypothetical protein